MENTILCDLCQISLDVNMALSVLDENHEYTLFICPKCYEEKTNVVGTAIKKEVKQDFIDEELILIAEEELKTWDFEELFSYAVTTRAIQYRDEYTKEELEEVKRNL